MSSDGGDGSDDIAGNVDGGRIFSVFQAPAGKQLCELGYERNWPELELLLASTSVEALWVTDARVENYVASVRKEFDVGRDSSGEGILHNLVRSEDNWAMMQRLLALGLDPDRASDRLQRPSHVCSTYARLRCAEAVSVCRPDLRAKNHQGRDPPDAAEAVRQAARENSVKQNTCRRIRDTWENFLRNGFPSLPHLAADKKWWAVKNLCRRRAIDSHEVRWKYRGKDVVQWAEFHGNKDLAAEVRFMYKEAMANKPESASKVTPEEVNALKEAIFTRMAKIEDRLNELESRLANEQEKVRAREKWIRDEAAQLRSTEDVQKATAAGTATATPLTATPSSVDAVVVGIKTVLDGLRILAEKEDTDKLKLFHELVKVAQKFERPNNAGN